MFIKIIALEDKYVLTRLDDGTYWNGGDFVSDVSSAKKFDESWKASHEQHKLEELGIEVSPKESFILPVTVEVTGGLNRYQIADYLEKAAKLLVNREEHGNGPVWDSYVDVEAHWHLAKPLIHQFDDDPDDPQTSWGYTIYPEDL